MPPLPSWRNSSYSGAKAAGRRSKKVDTVPEPRNIPATVLKVKRPRAYRGRFTAALASRRLLHRDRDVHAKGDVRQAIALVDAGRCPGKRHVVLFIGLRQDRPHEVAHRVGHTLFQDGRTALRDRIGVEGDVVGTARHVDEPHRGAGLDAELVGLERGYAGTIAGHLHFDDRASGLGRGRSGRRSGRRGCGSLGLGRRRLLVAAAGDDRERGERGEQGEPHCRLPPGRMTDSACERVHNIFAGSQNGSPPNAGPLRFCTTPTTLMRMPEPSVPLIPAVDLARRLDQGEHLQLLDIRSAERVAQGRVTLGATLNFRALAVDPGRHLQPYEQVIEDLGATAAAVIDTHMHADYLSGARAAAARWQVPYFVHPDDARSPYDGTEGRFTHQSLTEGDTIAFGRATLVAAHVPGHTLGSTALVADEALALTGDFLFVKSVGRPDLGGQRDAWAARLWDSLERVRREWAGDLLAPYPFQAVPQP